MAQQSRPTTMTTNQDKDKEKDKDTKSSRELEKDVQETRSAITSDIKSLNEKLSPAHIKEEAKGAVMNAAQSAADKASEVKDVIVDKASEVKDVVVEKAVEVKDVAAEKLSQAKDTVMDTVEDVEEQARRIGSATWQFTAANAVPLALIGVGAGWLIANRRKGSSRDAYDEDYGYEGEFDQPAGYTTTPSARAGVAGTLPSERSRVSASARAPRKAARAAVSRAGDRAQDLAGDGARRITESASDGARRIAESASDGARRIAESASRSAERMKDGLRRAGERTRTFADENPLAVAMAALVAGVGVGLALPSTEREARLLRPARAKLDSWIGEARSAASDVAQTAKDTASESLHALT
jgi:hypothetical protein